VKIVITGTYLQYKNYLRESGETPQTARYVYSREQIMGLQDVEVVYYGQYWFNKLACDPYVELIRKRESLAG